MDITGSQKIKAAQQQVFQALLNPEVLKNSIPGCEEAAVSDAGSQEIRLVLTTGIPGFKGPYTIFLQISEVEPPNHVVLTTEPNSSVGSVKARCVVNLATEGEYTQLSYEAHADIHGKIAATPEFILKSGVKSALDGFFKHFEKQVLSIPA